MLAIRIYLEGNSRRAIGRILQISQQSVANWVGAYNVGDYYHLPIQHDWLCYAARGMVAAE
jgi:transposase